MTPGMLWLWSTIFSALFLGLYEVFKKLSLRDNAVLPVLFCTPVICTLFFFPFLILSRTAPDCLSGTPLFVGELPAADHVYVMLKSLIVLVSWGLAYYAMKHLPITIASPVKSTQPMWVLVGAFLVFGERMNLWQWAGALIALTCLFFYSRIGEKEGISFVRNKWVWCLIGSVLTGAVSALYDKYLMGRFDRMSVQIWYTFYQMLLMVPVMAVYIARERRHPSATPVSEGRVAWLGGFEWRWSILALGLLLCVADFLYFYALSIPDSMISVVSPIRRSGVIVPFLAGAVFMKEKHIREKGVLLLGVLIGILCLYFGTL